MHPSTGVQAQLKSSGVADAMDYVAHCTDGDGYHIEEPVWGTEGGGGEGGNEE